ncbi:MAG: hypothetical protein ACLU4N_19090 [Butyricimonas faecihominis]
MADQVREYAGFFASLGYQGNVAENISPDFIAKVWPWIQNGGIPDDLEKLAES